MATTSPNPQQLLAQLQADFNRRLPERIAALLARVEPACAGDAAERDELLRGLHSLAGAGGTFGLPEVSARARELENQLRASKTLSAAMLRASIAGLHPPTPVDTATAVARTNGGPSPVAVTTGDIASTDADFAAAVASPFAARALFYLGSDNRDIGDIAGKLAKLQLPMTICDNAAMLMQRLQHAHERLAVVINIGADLPAAAPVLKGLAPQLLAPHLLILVTARRDLLARLQAARLGARAMLGFPLYLPDLVEVLEQPGWVGDSTPFRVLIVDDDRSISQYHAAVLSAAGMQVQTCDEVERLDILMQDFAPELILLDMYMPNWDGPDIAKALRLDNQFLSVPLVFLSSEANRAVQLDAMRDGGDDFLVKPIAPAHLVEAVRIRVRRYRDLRTVMMTDSLTHVLNRRALFSGLERELARSRRLSAPLSAAILDLDHFKAINDTHGHAVGDSVLKGLTQYLRQRLRKTDLIGRMGGEEFMVVFPETELMAAWALLDDIRSQFADIDYIGTAGRMRTSFSAGIAQWHPDESITDWLKRADAKLYVAKAEGRNRVVSDDAP